MREYNAAPAVEIPASANLTDTVFVNATDRPDLVALSRKTSSGWTNVSSRQFRDEVAGVAKGLIAAGIEPGDRVGILSRTRYEWTLVDYAIWAAGAVGVPIYETASVEQVQWILSDSGACAIFVETADNEHMVEELRGDLTELRQVWCIEGGATDTLTSTGTDVSDTGLEQHRQAAGRDDLATIVYTSGTTGSPKGCKLTHGNMLFDVRAALAGQLQHVFSINNASTLLFLPLAHVFARIIEIGCIETGVRLGHSANIKELLPDLQGFVPTFILAVPRVFEKVYNSAEQQATLDGKGKIFHAAASTAIDYSRATDAGGPGMMLRLKHAVFDKLVYAKLRAALGGQTQYAVSGGAPLGERLGHFFRGMGVLVLEGYGMTETAAATAVNDPFDVKIGTVGKPMPGISVRIAEDGEVLVKGPHIFAGYWNNPAATKEILDEDGWLHTGDIGDLDSEGNLRITDRKKDLIVTAGGKNVAPAVLEDRLRAHPLVSQCVVVGDQRPYIAALVTLDEESLEGWKKVHSKPAEMTPADLHNDPDVTAEISSAVAAANQAVSQAEGVKRFHVLDRDFTVENGEMTPSLKVKRSVIHREFAGEIEGLYS